MSRLRVSAFCIALLAAPVTQLLAQRFESRAFRSQSFSVWEKRDSTRATPKHHTMQNAAWFTAYGIVAFGVIWVLPEDISKWPRDERKLNHLLDAYRSPPVWDQDPWFWNYAVHPVLGAYSYLAERNHGESRLRSFLFSTATSVGWEYGVEAWVEHPSAQDLWITSTTGSVLGELSYQATRKLARNGFNRWERVALVVINPIWIAQHGFSSTSRGAEARQ
jgi:hypothetical protein